MAWSEEQRKNAAIIYQVGQQVGASERDILIAIMAAIVESGLRNVHYGDRDSLGLFQQRAAWGSSAARTDPYKAAKMFFLGGAAGQRGLLDFANRGNMGLGEAAQAVQVSAFPDRYGLQEDAALGVLREIGKTHSQETATMGAVPGLGDLVPGAGKLEALMIPDAPSVTEVNGIGEITADEAGIGELSWEDPTVGMLDTPKFGQPTVDPMASLKMPTLEELGISKGPGGFSAPSDTGDLDAGGGGNSGIVGFAKKFLGTPYVWGGTSPSGFDCSGFTQYVFRKFGVSLPRVSADQGRSGSAVSRKAMRPGDLVFWDNSSRNYGADHVAIYLGNGLIIEAPRPGSVVQISRLYGDYWARRVG